LKKKTAFKIFFIVGAFFLFGLTISGLNWFFEPQVFKSKPDIRPSELSGSCKDCNVVIIDIDILRSDALACGTDAENAPNICSFSRQAAYFKNNISHSHYTLPSFVSGITSLYPMSHKNWSEFQNRIDSRIISLPRLLAGHGYKTIGMGIADDPNVPQGEFEIEKKHYPFFQKKINYILKAMKKKKFLLYIYIPGLHFPYLPETRKIDNEIKNNWPPGIEGIPTNWKEHGESLSEYIAKHYSEVFTAKAILKNKNLFEGDIINNKTKILSLFDKYLESEEQRANYLINAWKPIINTYLEKIDVNNPEHISWLKRRYLNMLGDFDTKISYLLKILDSLPYNRNTILIIKSEHGEEFYEHGKLFHDNLPYQQFGSY